MDEKFVWKGELVFKGGEEEFAKMVEHLEMLPFCRVNIKEWIDRPHHLAGCFPFPLESLLTERLLGRLTENVNRMAIRFPQDIPGGIRYPHMHLQDEVVLLDRNQFKVFAGEVAKSLAELRVDEVTDYIDVMGPINSLEIQKF